MTGIGLYTILTVLTKIGGVVYRLFGGKKDETAERMKEDKELADAIKRGDAETVAKIRERRRRYMSIIILFLCVILSGCTYFKYHNVPLSQGTTPYQLPAGQYVDAKGELHVETQARWSLSEEDLFNSTRDLTKKKWYEDYRVSIGVALVVMVSCLALGRYSRR